MLIEGNGDIYCPFMKELGMISAEYMTLIIKLKSWHYIYIYYIWLYALADTYGIYMHRF